MVAPDATSEAVRSSWAFLLLVRQQPRQLEALSPLEQLPLRLRLLAQAPQPNEAPGRLVIELIAALVRRQLLAIHAPLALAGDHLALPFVQLPAHHPRHEALVAGHEVPQ